MPFYYEDVLKRRRNEIHINLKFNADALNRRRRRFCVRRTV